MISKALSLLLTVLVVTSLFIPAVAANEETANPTITPEEALKFRIEHGYLTKFTSDDRGYRYRYDDVWDIYTSKKDCFKFNADNDTKRMVLLEFMQMVEEEHNARVAFGVGGLIVFGGVMFLAVTLMTPVMIVPALVLGAASAEFISAGIHADSVANKLTYKSRLMKNMAGIDL